MIAYHAKGLRERQFVIQQAINEVIIQGMRYRKKAKKEVRGSTMHYYWLGRAVQFDGLRAGFQQERDYLMKSLNTWSEGLSSRNFYLNLQNQQ